MLFQVRGSANDDWRLQTSTNLESWTNLTSFGTLLSGGTNAPWRSVDTGEDSSRFYRALQTEGLYDRSLLRTISMTFTQANWSNLMVLARTYETNVYCTLLIMDNGATNVGVGARFRGNTSFTGMGEPGASTPAKKSLSISI
jgi:hypothetical protein